MVMIYVLRMLGIDILFMVSSWELLLSCVQQQHFLYFGVDTPSQPPIQLIIDPAIVASPMCDLSPPNDTSISLSPVLVALYARLDHGSLFKTRFGSFEDRLSAYVPSTSHHEFHCSAHCVWLISLLFQMTTAPYTSIRNKYRSFITESI